MTEYLELNVTDCKHCYKCIRNCPVKAINFSQNQATILQEECVLCGRCFVICPQNAKHVRNDLPAAKALVQGEAPVVASLAPSFVANWPGATIQSMRKALLQLGFDEADETALGATLVKQQYETTVDSAAQKVIITTCCHTVNTLVQKHFPGALTYMASILSPMQAHCASIKQHRPGAKTVFIGPCVSKKAEAEQYPGIVDCVLTYEELEAWLAEAGVELDCPKAYGQDAAGRARLFPIPGGILRTMERSNPNYSYIAVDGMENCIAALEDITTGRLENCFVEMSACSGSCVGGPAVSRERGLIQKYSHVNTYAVSDDFEVLPLKQDAFAKAIQPTTPVRRHFSDQAIAEVLQQIGKTKPEDELNCGCCGYDTCRDKARAVLAGKANLEMCLPYLMSKAQSFSDNIIRNTPNGILVLNEALEIQQINGAACKMLNVARPEDVLDQRVVCVMAAMPVIEVLDGGRPIYDRHQYLAEYDRYITLTVTRDKEYGLIIAIMRDITETETTKAARKTLAEKTIQVTDEVIDKQMRTVQEIAAYACGADEGYIYVRAEYPMAVERLRIAIAQAEAYGLLGEDILGSGFNFRLHINRGAGAFVCGEGSALTASIEGKRGMPRVKPPRTVEQGLFDKPTVLNNVETFANVPIIIEKGAAWYKFIGPESSPGTKAFALTGNIENTGLIEVPMGTTLRQIIFDVGGGMRGGGEFKAVQIGGPSGACLTAEHLDLPLDFDSLKKVGAMIGSGGLVVMDDSTCMVEVARFFMNFTQNESCGKCVPCREGTRRMLEILERIVGGQGEAGDIDLLLELADTISATALCGLGKSAAFPVVSTIRSFRSEYEAHINDKRCPAGSCQKLKQIAIDPALCKGCSKCSRSCPVTAISGVVKQPFVIDAAKCIKCEACIPTCPFGAIKAS